MGLHGTEPKTQKKRTQTAAQQPTQEKINQRADKFMRKLKKQSAETQKSIHEQTIHGKGLHTFRMCEVQVPHLLVIARTVYTNGLCFTFAHLTVLWITVFLPKMCWKWFQTRLVEVAATHSKSKSIYHMSVMVFVFENNEISNELVSECPGQVSVVSGCPQYHKFPPDLRCLTFGMWCTSRFQYYN